MDFAIFGFLTDQEAREMALQEKRAKPPEQIPDPEDKAPVKLTRYNYKPKKYRLMISS